MLTIAAALPAKLDQPDHPIGMGLAFVILLVIVGFVAMLGLMIGVLRNKKRTNETLDYPVLLKEEDKVGYRPTKNGRPSEPRR